MSASVPSRDEPTSERNLALLSITTQRWCVWSGPLLICLTGLGICVIMGFVPPPSPHDTAQQIQHLFTHDRVRIRIGAIFTILTCGLAFPWAVAIAVQMQRIEGRWAPMALSELIAGVALPLLYILPMLMWAAAAFRPETRPAAVTQLASDIGWFTFVGVGAPAIIQSLTFAAVVFRDPRPEPVFERWVAYFNIWCAVIFVAGALCLAFQVGPFAWNGVFAFWIPLTVFVVWMGVMTWVLLAAIKTQEREFLAAPEVDITTDGDVRAEVQRLSRELAALRDQAPA